MSLLHLPPALRNRRFTIFWVGLIISNIGSQMQVTALLWHLRLLNNNPIVVSGIGLARVIPILLFAPTGRTGGGHAQPAHDPFHHANHHDPGGGHAWGYLTVSGVIQIWHIYLLTGIQATALAFDVPARQSMPPNLVERKDLTSAVSIQSVGFNTGAIIGPALSGLVIAYLGMQYVYFINAISFFAVLIALMVIGPVKQKLQQGEERTAAAADRHPGRLSFRLPPAHHLFQHGAGFLCHLLFLRQHPAAIRGTRHPGH